MEHDELCLAVQGALDAGQDERAVRLLEKLAETDSSSPRTFLRLGELYGRLDALAEACTAYGKAAALLRTRDQKEKALAVYRRLVALDKTDAPWRLEMADILIDLGHKNEAAHQLDLYATQLRVAGRVDDSAAVSRQVESLRDAEVAEVLRRAAAAPSSESKMGVLTAAAARFLTLGQSDRYLSVADRILTLRPNDQPRRLESAQVLMACQRREEALVHLNILLKRDPQHVPALSALAKLHDQRREPALSGAAYKTLGGILNKQGDSSGGIAAYQEALRLVPGDAEARAALAELSGSVPAQDASDDPDDYAEVFYGATDDTPAESEAGRVDPEGGDVEDRDAIRSRLVAQGADELDEPDELEELDRTTSVAPLAAGGALPRRLSAAGETGTATTRFGLEDDTEVLASFEALLPEPVRHEVVTRVLGECDELVRRMVEKLRAVLDIAPADARAKSRLALSLMQLGQSEAPKDPELSAAQAAQPLAAPQPTAAAKSPHEPTSRYFLS